MNFVDRLYFAWFGALSIVVIGFHARVPRWPVYLAVHGICIAIIAAFVLLSRQRPGGNRASARSHRVASFLHQWYPLAIFIVCFEEVSRLSLVIVRHWQDYYLLRFESLLFPTPPTVWFGRFSQYWWITESMELGYFSYFVLLMIVGGVLYGRVDKRPFRRVMAASVVSYMLCYVVFLVWPTEGPAHTLRAWHTAPVVGGPFHWLVLLIQHSAGVHGNAFPSSHVAAGLVALIFAWRHSPRLGAWLTPLVLLLCVGAVYDRYHYASDVVAGLAVGWFADWLVRRIESAVPRVAF